SLRKLSAPHFLDRPRLPRQRTRKHIHPEIIPRRVHLFDQIDFPLPRIPLDRLLALDRDAHALMHLIPDQSSAVVLARKACTLAAAMLRNALHEIGGHAGVDRAVPPVGHHVDRNGLEPPHPSPPIRPTDPTPTTGHPRPCA